MAFVLKNVWPAGRRGTVQEPVLEQWIRVSRAAATLQQSASTNEPIFNVDGGRILLKALIGEVTVVISGGTTPDLQIEVNSDAGATDVDLASDVAITDDEVGTMYGVEGDGTALIATSSGWAPACIGMGVVINPGVIQYELTEASIAGQIRWDLYYIPLDPAAFVTAV